MASSTNDLLGAASPLLLPSSVPNPTTAAALAVVAPLPSPALHGVGLVLSDRQQSGSAAGETRAGSGVFLALGLGLILLFAAIGVVVTIRRFLRWATWRTLSRLNYSQVRLLLARDRSHHNWPRGGA